MLLVAAHPSATCLQLALCRPVVLLRLREKMVQAEPEEQVNFIIWTLEAASRLAMQQPRGERGPRWAALPLQHQLLLCSSPEV